MILAKKITKTYYDKTITTEVLRGVDISIKNGEFVAIMGRSGAGKSTLMYQLGLLDRPTSGTLQIDGVDTVALSETERTNFRLKRLGYVFQDYALIPELSASENIMIPLLMRGLNPSKAAKMAIEALQKVELSHRPNNLPRELSGGEQQRVSIARAIVHTPDILFADEPTANLDSASAKTVLNLFKQLNKDGQTIVMVTHEEEYGQMADRIIRLADGLIIGS